MIQVLHDNSWSQNAQQVLVTRLMAKFSGQLGRWGSLDFFAEFAFYMAVWGFGRVPIALVASLRFKLLDSQPDSSNMGPVSTDFHEFCDFLKSWGGFLTRYLSCFRPGCFTIHIFQVFGRDQKEPRRKVTQIRGGITSGSAFFDCFRPI